MKLLEHFLVYRCVGCDDAIPAGTVLCEECGRRFAAECASPCRYCHGKHIECGCYANGKKSPADRVMHIAPYRSSGIAHKMVTQCKRIRDKTLFDFIGHTVSMEAERKLPIGGNTLIVPLPRSRRAVVQNGFDQAKLVAEVIAKDLGAEYADAFLHHGRTMQKSLGYRERMANAKTAFLLKAGCEDKLRGRHVILYDDIITTGATAVRCIRLAREAGATRVDFVSFARTER